METRIPAQSLKFQPNNTEYGRPCDVDVMLVAGYSNSFAQKGTQSDGIESGWKIPLYAPPVSPAFLSPFFSAHPPSAQPFDCV